MISQRFEFKSETKKILELVTHSLYSNPDVFLRELISNASDALDKARFESLTNNKILEEKETHGAESDIWKIHIKIDKSQKILRIQDNGIGMNWKDMEDNLGTIARSGTQKFMELLKKRGEKSDQMSLIGQFGVGFYSAFMVANIIEVQSRRVGEPGVLWKSEGGDSYEISEDPHLNLYRGTQVSLHLKESCLEYLEEPKIRSLVTEYSNYIDFPILMDVKKEGSLKDASGKAITTQVQDVLNSQKAIWMRPKSQVEPQEYQSFYKHLSQDNQDPLKWEHYKVEGAVEFSSILYLPKQKAMDLYLKERVKNNVHLYVKRVFILKECQDLLPNYLRFITGVVDSSDLPLNVSREILQEHRLLKVIRKSLVKKILGMIQQLKKENAIEYKRFYQEFSALLKEGVYEDHENKKTLLDLLMYQTSKTSGGEQITLKQYVQRMQAGQKHLYYISGDLDDVKKASHLEMFQDKGYEVLYFVEPMDEIMLQGLAEYEGKLFKSILQGDAGLSSQHKDLEKKYEGLTQYLKKVLAQKVEKVRVSGRLTKSPSCLVLEEGSMSQYMENLMKAYQKQMPKVKKILEINLQHPLLQEIQTLYEEDRSHPHLRNYIELVYGAAVILEGGKLDNAFDFVENMSLLVLEKNPSQKNIETVLE